MTDTEKYIFLGRTDLIHLLHCYEAEVHEPQDLTPFLDKAMNGGCNPDIIFNADLLPGSRFSESDESPSGYKCEWCGHWDKARNCRIVDEHIMCNRCNFMEHGYPKEGE